jgi:hypothetical protein
MSLEYRKTGIGKTGIGNTTRSVPIEAWDKIGQNLRIQHGMALCLCIL